LTILWRSLVSCLYITQIYQIFSNREELAPFVRFQFQLENNLYDSFSRLLESFLVAIRVIHMEYHSHRYLNTSFSRLRLLLGTK